MVLWKSSCDELWTCGCVAVAGSGVFGGLETWMRRVANVWFHCGGRDVTSGWRNNVRNELGMCDLIVAFRAGVDSSLETWMPLVVDVLWIQCGGSGLTGVGKLGATSW